MSMLLSTTYVSAKFKHGAAVALCLFMLFSCNTNQRSIPSIPDISNFIVDSVYLPVSEADRPKGGIKEIGRGKCAPQELVAFMKDRSMNLYFYDIDNNTFLDSLPLADYWNYYPNCYAVGIDSVYLLLESNKIVRIFGKHKKMWDVSPVTSLIGKKVFIGRLSANPLVVFNDTAICTTTTWDGPDKPGPNVPFLEANHDIVFSISGDTAKSLARHNPNPPYFSVQDYDARAEKVYLNSREIVYSFDHSDTLYRYNFFTGSLQWFKLKTVNFFPNTPYDYNQSASMTYGNNYIMSNSRMGMGTLFYDSLQGKIFQIMQHRGRYINEDGSKNTYEDLPQSLFVLDERMNQLIEIYIPPKVFGPIYFTFITHKGLYFAAHSSKQRYKDKTLFYRIVVP